MEFHENEHPNLRYFTIVEKIDDIQIQHESNPEWDSFDTKKHLIPGLGNAYFKGSRSPAGEMISQEANAIFIGKDGTIIGKVKDFIEKFNLSFWLDHQSTEDVETTVDLHLKYPGLNKSLSAWLDFGHENSALATSWEDIDGTRYEIFCEPDPEVLSKIGVALEGKTEKT